MKNDIRKKVKKVIFVVFLAGALTVYFVRQSKVDEETFAIGRMIPVAYGAIMEFQNIGDLTENTDRDLPQKSVTDENECLGKAEIPAGQDNPFMLPNDWYTMIGVDKGFYEKFATNPIDEKWKWNEERDGSSTARIEFAGGYKEAWEMQIKHTLTVLKENLTEKDFALIEEAYVNWKLYMENTTDVEISIFYIGQNYGIGDEVTYPMVLESVAMRTKYYAVDLMALEYALVGNMEFVTVK